MAGPVTAMTSGMPGRLRRAGVTIAGALTAACVLSVFSTGCKMQQRPIPDSLDISVPYELDTLDPHASDTISNFAVLANCYEPLVRTDANLKVQPCLASTWATPDPSTWVFRLERSAKFHSGKPLQARDVVYSLRRLMTSRNLEMGTYTTAIEDVKELDPYAVQITTKRPQSVFLNKLNFLLIIPEGMTAERMVERVDGTGPYQLYKWEPDLITLDRNDRYRGKKPDFQKVRIHLRRTPQDAIEDLLSGKSQFVQCSSRNLDKLAQARDRFGIHRRESLFVKYLAFDMARDITPYCAVRPNPFKNRLVRKALSLAIDRQRLASSLTAAAVPATQPVPAFVFGFNPEIGLPPYDPALAREFLAEAGLPDGFEVTLHVRQILGEAALLVREQLDEVGVRVGLKVLQDHEFFQAAGRHEMTFMLSRLGCPIGDASQVLELAFHSPDPQGLLGRINYGAYSDPEIDRIARENTELMNIADRGRALQEAMSKLMDDLVWIPLYIDQDVYAMDGSLSWQPRHDSYILAEDIAVRR
ncbi:MAG: ABC transporter substrate-binding protein [Acidobacteriota bacterium]